LRRIAIDPLDRALLGIGYKANPDFGGAALADLHSRNPGADKFALSGSLFCSFRGRGPFHGRNGKLVLGPRRWATHLLRRRANS
jgi:hypothetical protein